MTTPRLRGVVPPMVTPLRSRDALDVPGLERLIEHILAGGVHGLFILGTTGEAPALGYRTLVLSTVRRFAAALALYRSLGFVEATRPDNPDAAIQIDMRLELT